MDAEYSDAFAPLPLLNGAAATVALATMVPDDHSLNTFEQNAGDGEFSFNENDVEDLDSLSAFGYASQNEMDFDEQDDGIENIEPLDIQHDRYSYYGGVSRTSSDPHYGAERHPTCHNTTASEDLVSDLLHMYTATPSLKGSHAHYGNYRNNSCPSKTGSSVTAESTYDMHSMNGASCNRSDRSAPVGPQISGSNFYSFYRYSETPQEQSHATDQQSWEHQTARSVQNYPVNVHSAFWVGGNTNSWQGGQQPCKNLYGTSKSSSGVSQLNKNFNAMNCVSENEPSYASCPDQNIHNHLEPTMSAGGGASRVYSYYSMTGGITADIPQYAPAPSSSAPRAMSYQGADDEHTRGRQSGSFQQLKREPHTNNNFDTVSCESMPVNLPSFSAWKDNPSPPLLMANEGIPGTESRGPTAPITGGDRKFIHLKRKSAPTINNFDTVSCVSMPVNLPSFSTWKEKPLPMAQEENPSTETMGPTKLMESKSNYLNSFRNHTARRRLSLSSNYDTFDTLSCASMPAAIPSAPTSPTDTKSDEIIPFDNDTAERKYLSSSADDILDTLPFASMPAAIPSISTLMVENAMVQSQSPSAKSEKLDEESPEEETRTSPDKKNKPGRKPRSGRPKARAKKASVLEASNAEKQWHMKRTRIVLPGDPDNGTKFSHGVVGEYCSTTFQVKDRRGKRKGLDYGFPGLTCYHCNGADKVGGRYFPSTIKTMSDTKKTLISIYKHLQKCKKCPEEVRQRLQRLQLTHDDERKTQSYGSQKAFFTILWNRLHESENESKNESKNEINQEL
jgi:hypothetical protein